MAVGDTIVALSTAAGAGAIGIVRMSGPEAVAIAAGVFRPVDGSDLAGSESHRVRYGHVLDPSNGRAVDEALVLLMRAPATYTREDVVEVHCHGGSAAQRAVLRLLIAQGARPAEPGEFTKRAFLAGRIDLAQAESVAGLVRARSASALRAAMRQLEGGLSDRIRDLRSRMIQVLARLEVGIDFSDEDVDEVDRPQASAQLQEIERDLRGLLETALLGRALEQGVRTAIVGRPNVGKSSLLNALLMRERAIVSEVPGTTRDTVEELAEIAGIPLHLVDTAGLRSSHDHLERLGIERSRRAVEQADLVLAVIDLSEGVTSADEELLAGLPGGRVILVGNKCDLAPVSARARAGARAPGDLLGSPCAVSALTGEGLDLLRDAIQNAVVGDGGLHLEEPLLATERQRLLAEEAVRGLESARRVLDAGLADELVCEDVRSSIQALGSITGEDLMPDLLDEIFHRFCIGK